METSVAVNRMLYNTEGSGGYKRMGVWPLFGTGERRQRYVEADWSISKRVLRLQRRVLEDCLHVPITSCRLKFHFALPSSKTKKGHVKGTDSSSPAETVGVY